MSGQIVGYVRVSSAEQNPGRQVVALGEVEETFTGQVSGESDLGCSRRVLYDALAARGSCALPSQ